MNSIYLKNKITGDVKQVSKGFNWGVFCFGPIYLFVKGCYKQGVGLFIVNGIAISYLGTNGDFGGFAIVVLLAHAFMAFSFSNFYMAMLERRDYKPIEADQ